MTSLQCLVVSQVAATGFTSTAWEQAISVWEPKLSDFPRKLTLETQCWHRISRAIVRVLVAKIYLACVAGKLWSHITKRAVRKAGGRKMAARNEEEIVSEHFLVWKGFTVFPRFERLIDCNLSRELLIPFYFTPLTIPVLAFDVCRL